jgi:metal-dependent amidase/aminoacylase/carboxypeptidase family protein
MLDKAQKLSDELIRLRRDIYQHPEPGFGSRHTGRNRH